VALNIPHVGDVVDALAALLAANPAPALYVGVGEKPDSVPDSNPNPTVPAPGWVVLYPLPLVGSAGPIADPYADTPFEIQTTCVGWSQQQATLLGDTAAQVLLSAAGLAVSGRVVDWVEPLSGQPARREDAVDPPLWQITAQYEIRTTPA
jgi:hypothetical protein